jgi:hypothetical protein
MVVLTATVQTTGMQYIMAILRQRWSKKFDRRNKQLLSEHPITMLVLPGSNRSSLVCYAYAESKDGAKSLRAETDHNFQYQYSGSGSYASGSKNSWTHGYAESKEEAESLNTENDFHNILSVCWFCWLRLKHQEFDSKLCLFWKQKWRSKFGRRKRL